MAQAVSIVRTPLLIDRLVCMVLLSAAICCYPQVSGASERPARSPALASRNWSVTASPNLTQRPPSNREVQNFVAGVEFALGEIDEVDRRGIYACSWRFLDLRQDGFLSLVGVPCPSDRPSDIYPFVIDHNAKGFELYWSPAAIGPGQTLASSLQDLRGDGKLEFVVDDPLGSIQGQCLGNWTAIYAWTGSGYTNVSDQFKEIYQRRLATIEKILATVRAGRAVDDHLPQETECLEAEAGAIQDFLGISSKRAEEQAVRLANSKDVREREFGTTRLIQVSVPENRKLLEKLASDPNWGISTSAKQALLYPGAKKFVPDSFESVGGATF